MKIGLVAMSGVRVRTAELAALGVTLPGFVRRGRVIAALPSLGLLTVAGLTPPGHEITYLEVDDLAEPRVPAGASIWSASRASPPGSTPRTSWPTGSARAACPSSSAVSTSRSCHDEALDHADAVVVGGAEGAWPRVVADAGQGRLACVYEGARSEVFEPRALRDPALRPPGGSRVQPGHRPDSRGCPRACEFCAASLADHDAIQPEAGRPGDRGDPRRPAARRRAVLRAGRRQHVPRPAMDGRVPAGRDPGGHSLLHRDRCVAGRRPRAVRSTGGVGLPPGLDRVREPPEPTTCPASTPRTGSAAGRPASGR